MKEEVKKIRFYYNLKRSFSPYKWAGVLLLIVVIKIYKSFFIIDWKVLLPVVVLVLSFFHFFVLYKVRTLKCPICRNRFIAPFILKDDFKCMSCGEKLEDL